MKCIICNYGENKPGLVTVTLEREEYIVVMKKMFTEVCKNCGEYYLNDEMTE